MHKVLGFIAIAINCYAWLSTFESNRNRARNNRPEIRQEIEKKKALAIVEQQKSESTSLLQSPPQEMSNETDEQLLTKYSILSGELLGARMGKEYRYLIEVKFTKAGADSFDAGQWKAQVLVMNIENLHYLSLYKSKPIVQNGIITLDLESSDKYQAFNYNSDDVTVQISKLVISIDAKGQIQSGAEDDQGGKWRSRLTRVDMSAYKALAGEWKGRFPNGTSGKIKIDFEGDQIVGAVQYNHSIGACRARVPGYLHENNQLIFIGGSINDHTACISNFVIRFKEAEGQLLGVFYDYSTSDNNEFRFQR